MMQVFQPCTLMHVLNKNPKPGAQKDRLEPNGIDFRYKCSLIILNIRILNISRENAKGRISIRQLFIKVNTKGLKNYLCTLKDDNFVHLGISRRVE